MRILIAVTTGRRVFRETLNMLATNIALHGHSENHFIGSLINYDTEFTGLADAEFKYDQTEVFRENLMLGPTHAIEFRNYWISSGVLPLNVAHTLLPITGYGNRRNLIILEAIRRGYDTVLFWDDDEYPVACIQHGSQVTWESTDIVGAHLDSLGQDADVTCGFRTGYALPIDSTVHQRLNTETLNALGQALSIGTEFITTELFLDPANSFLTTTQLPLPVEILEIDGGKWVTAGNLSVSIPSVISGRIPPFFVPFGGRGEDTIFSLQLQDASVYSVPSGIFHDCFLEYREILNGKYPKSINPISVADHHLHRFSEALKGWLSYSPLLLWMRDRGTCAEKLSLMVEHLQLVDRRMEREYPQMSFSLGLQLTAVLENAIAQRNSEYTRLTQARDAWYSVLSSV